MKNEGEEDTEAASGKEGFTGDMGRAKSLGQPGKVIKWEVHT